VGGAVDEASPARRWPAPARGWRRPGRPRPACVRRCRAAPEKARPSGPVQDPMDSSIGNSPPSRRSPASSTTWPASLEVPVRATRAMPSVWSSRNRPGMITVSGRPTTSSAVQPNIRSAPRFQVSSRLELSAETIASTAASVPAWNCSWEAGQGLVGLAPLDQGAELLGDPGIPPARRPARPPPQRAPPTGTRRPFPAASVVCPGARSSAPCTLDVRISHCRADL
jgi:hypothetical protein